MTKNFKDGKPLKPNKKEKITNDNLNYTDADIDNVEPIFPEDNDLKQPTLKQNRLRYETLEEIPDTLPTMDLLPYPIDEHMAIGQYEQRKNFYLTFAILNNRLVDRIEKLEQEIKKLKNK